MIKKKSLNQVYFMRFYFQNSSINETFPCQFSSTYVICLFDTTLQLNPLKSSQLPITCLKNSDPVTICSLHCLLSPCFTIHQLHSFLIFSQLSQTSFCFRGDTHRFIFLLLAWLIFILESQPRHHPSHQGSRSGQRL